ncbi:DNA gyrase inhibitor YacG [Verminephrobacter eiseniae]|uniref:DNA gyrase inhibitor YacG n=1 Tax=Verminephrobacter eiseniae TaxID=364317 RepID=UPI0022372250|nr:DNA gyrase inhibitor YacG [Verminephrobacter eiseniae]MCW5259956.1 DNA gyrase inhibitor YacG [Verminephrobacter eiseniae]
MTHSRSTDARERIVRCPGCRGDSVYGPGNAYRPFCSQRCKLADLGAWASEQFRMPAQDPPDDPPDDADPGRAH